MNTSRFLFQNDFRAPKGRPADAAALEAAEARGFARGLQEGHAKAESEARAQLAQAAARLSATAAQLLARADADRAATEEEAAAFAAMLARKLAGDALRAEPLAAIAEAARTALGHLRGVPHLAVRVGDALVEDVDALVRRLAREQGYEGRIVVLGDPDIAPGDARIEWADGGVVRDQRRIEAAVAEALAKIRLADR